MNLDYSDEQKLLRDSVRRFLAEEYGFARRKLIAASAEGYSREVWSQFADLGWLALPIPEAAGGLGGGEIELGLLMEGFGGALVLEPYLATVVLGAEAVVQLGDAHQRAAWLPGVAGGELHLALAHGEGAGPRWPATVSTRARRVDGGWRLEGAKHRVVGAAAANTILVSARVAGDALDPQGVGLFAVPRDAAGLELDRYALTDGSVAADLKLNGVLLGADALLGGNDDALESIEQVQDRGIAALAADALGALGVLLEATVEYTKTRVQFGQPIARFQALQHRLADLAVLREEARSMSLLALLKARSAPAERARAVSGAKLRIGRAARRIGEEAIQMHGAMGVTDELNIGAYFKRVLCFDLLFGSAAAHTRRYAGLMAAEAAGNAFEEQDAGRVSAAGPDLGLTADEQTFRHSAREFLTGALQPEVARAQRMTSTVFAEVELSQPWHKKLYQQGWVAPGWPSEYGGPGWTPVQRYIWEVEAARAGAPMTSPIGLSMVGPVLMHFGTPEQKSQFLPRILSGEDYWCQGFSEPGAGSDLAALRTRAMLDGDCYVVTGAKIWTTHAHKANWMIALVRTRDTGRRQEGISCLLIDMASSGIEVRPIYTIGGDHEVNQVSFDAVRVPVHQRVAAEGEGWTVAKYLLEFERGGGIVAPGLRDALAEVCVLAAEVAARDADPAEAQRIRHRIAELSMEIDALEMLELRSHAGRDETTRPAAAASMQKLRASELHQGLSALALEVLGSRALRWEAQRPFDHAPEDPLLDRLRPAMSRYLNNRANTIFGGSSEIQRSIIAKLALGI